MNDSDPDYYSKEAILARLRAGKRGSDRNKTLVWILDGLALLAFFLPGYWPWIGMFVIARFVRGAPTPLGWITLSLIPISVALYFFWQVTLSPYSYLTGLN